MVGSVREKYATYVNGSRGQMAARDNENAILMGENANLRSMVQQQARELACREIYNNFSRGV